MCTQFLLDAPYTVFNKQYTTYLQTNTYSKDYDID